MLFTLLTVVVAGVAGASAEQSPQSYEAAYRAAEAQGKPLMVVIGADWCPACTNLKSTTLASMKSEGELEEVSVAVVDQDADPALARQLKQGQSLPQIIVFSKTEAGNWRRLQLNGFQKEGNIRKLIRRAVSSVNRRSS